VAEKIQAPSWLQLSKQLKSAYATRPRALIMHGIIHTSVV